MSTWFMVLFIILFLVSSAFLLFFNPVVTKKPLIKMASRHEDEERPEKSEGEKSDA
jgi:hypothetical protein